MYDGSSDSWGLIKSNGSRRAGFYAMRLAVMALNGGKAVYPTQLSSSTNVRAITTREGSGGYNLLMTNRSSTSYKTQADVSSLLASGSAELYLFNGSRKGSNSLTRLSAFRFSGGKLNFDLPPSSIVLVRFRS
jgi:hypothetical protein